jgi:AraC-like DNA-binding protein
LEASDAVKVFVQTPSEVLRPFVKLFHIIEFPTGHNDWHLPDTGAVAAFRFKGDCRIDGGVEAPRTALTGLRDQIRAHEHGKDSAVLTAAFTPAGAAALLRHDLDDVFNATVALDDILGRATELNQVLEQLAEAKNHADRLQVVERFLMARSAHAQPDALVFAAVSKIEETSGKVRIEHLAQRLDVSQSTLERRFSRVAGASPKRFASIVRLQHVLRLRETGADFTSVAHAAGYYDQSHFIRDFKRITGLAPEAYFGRAGSS